MLAGKKMDLGVRSGVDVQPHTQIRGTFSVVIPVSARGSEYRITFGKEN